MRSHPPVSFTLDYQKLISCIGHFAERCNDLTKLKAVKLLYFLDKNHLLKHGRPVLGDNYVKMGYGPVPSMALDILNEIIDAGQMKVKMLDSENKEYFEKYIGIKHGKYPVFRAITEPNLDVLSESEKEALSQTQKAYGKLAASTLVNRSHEDETFKQSELNHYIDYKLFFEGERAVQPDALEYFKSLEENVGFLNVLDANA